MSHNTVRRDIEQRFKDNWILTKMGFDNVPMEEKPAPGEAWIEVSIFEDSVTRITKGDPGVWRIRGTIAVAIFTKLNTGTIEVRTLADAISALFRAQTFNGIHTSDPLPANVGEDNSMYRMNVTIPFRWEGSYTG